MRVRMRELVQPRKMRDQTVAAPVHMMTHPHPPLCSPLPPPPALRPASFAVALREWAPLLSVLVLLLLLFPPPRPTARWMREEARVWRGGRGASSSLESTVGDKR